MRGAPARAPGDLSIEGIIPADAGSTFITCTLLLAPPDHPRGCGEHPVPERINENGWGSSPRMRGARSLSSAGMRLGGIIPADAGSTTR